MWFLIIQMEHEDQALLNTSHSQIWSLVKSQVKDVLKKPSNVCIFLISFFNFIALIYCQLNFPCPSSLFISLFIQAFLGFISIIIPELAVFLLFMITCGLVPFFLRREAEKIVGFISLEKQIFFNFIFLFLDQRKSRL